MKIALDLEIPVLKICSQIKMEIVSNLPLTMKINAIPQAMMLEVETISIRPVSCRVTNVIFLSEFEF